MIFLFVYYSNRRRRGFASVFCRKTAIALSSYGAIITPGVAKRVPRPHSEHVFDGDGEGRWVRIVVGRLKKKKKKFRL